MKISDIELIHDAADATLVKQLAKDLGRFLVGVQEKKGSAYIFEVDDISSWNIRQTLKEETCGGYELTALIPAGDRLYLVIAEDRELNEVGREIIRDAADANGVRGVYVDGEGEPLNGPWKGRLVFTGCR